MLRLEEANSSAMPESLKQSTIKGIFWSGMERFSSQGIQFILSLIIARQLMPSDYGLVAMLGIFMALAQTFIDSGFSSALIQKQNRTETDFSTVFYFNIVIAIVIYALFWLIAPLIADFYNQDLLKEITVWVALNFVISAFATVQRAKLTIELDFRKQTIISLIAVIISGGVSVWMAYNGYGVWTLVVQGLLNNIVNTLLLWIFTKWTPQIIFSIASFKELFGFGSKLLLGGVLNTLYTNMYSLVIGKAYSPTDLGYFNRASTITQYPSINITNILTRVTYPVECKIQDDNTKLQDTFFLFIKATSSVVFPLMIGLAAIAEPLVRLILTEKWLPAVPYIRLMCLAYMLDPIMRMSYDLLNVKHRSDLSLKSEVIKKTIAFAILFSTMPFGLTVVCVGLIVYSFCDLFIITRYTTKLLPNITFFNIIKQIYPILCISLLMGSTILFIVEYAPNIWIQTIGGLLIGIIVYGFLSLLFNKNFIKSLLLYLKK